MLQKNELYEKLSDERKKLQADGEVPNWLTTMGWQMLKNKSYLYKTNSLKVTFERVAQTAAKHLKPEHQEYYKKRFFEVLWDGHLALSTPAYNLGTPKGFPVSCTGNTIDDSVFGFYDSVAEVANLTKEYFGTSSYIGGIRKRGSKISRGGTASGIVPVFKSHVQVMDDITQGTARRGSWGGYIDLMHGDFDELVDEIMAEPEGYNLGVNYYDADLIRISNGDPETIRRFQKHMKLRAIFGKGYFYFVDRTHRHQPPMYDEHGLRSLASNLCLTGDTIISIKYDDIEQDVTLKYFCDNFDSMRDNVEVMTAKGYSKVSNAGMTGKSKTLVKITSPCGKVIKCTPDHKVFTKNRGYVMAKYLTVDDVLDVQ